MTLKHLSKPLQLLDKQVLMQEQLKNTLKPLQEINGYLAAAIFNKRGIVLVEHNPSHYLIETVGAELLAMLNNTIEIAHEANFGTLNFVQVNFQSAILGAVYMTEEQLALIVLFETKGNIGLAKLALIKLAEQIKSELEIQN